MTIGEKLGAVGAVIGALVIIICMVLYIPFIKVDGEQISLMQMFKDSKPLESMEGELSSKTSSYEVRSEVDSTLDDGLDLDQLVEGQFTILFCGFDEGRSNTDVNMLAVCDIAANTINILQIPRDSYLQRMHDKMQSLPVYATNYDPDGARDSMLDMLTYDRICGEDLSGQELIEKTEPETKN